MPSLEIVTEPIAEGDPAAGFSCGEPDLDRFFAEHAVPNDRRGIGRTFVLRRAKDRPDLPPILGFYTLSMADIAGGSLPRRFKRHLPRYPLPVALVGRFAVDARAQHMGIGELLLRDAFSRILTAALNVACVGVIVDAKTDRAETFYFKYGFIALEANAPFPRRMFLPVETIRAATT